MPLNQKHKTPTVRLLVMALAMTSIPGTVPLAAAGQLLSEHMVSLREEPPIRAGTPDSNTPGK